MKKWQLCTATALLSASLATIGVNTYHAIQPTHYQGETFDNEKKPSHTHNSSASSTSQPASDSTEQTTTTNNDTSVNTSASQPTSVENQEWADKVVIHDHSPQLGGTVDPNNPNAYWNNQPTFYAYFHHDDANGEPNGFRVMFAPQHEEVKCKDAKDAELFAKWMESIAHGKDHLNHSLQSNYAYWLQNVKGQQ